MATYCSEDNVWYPDEEEVMAANWTDADHWINKVEYPIDTQVVIIDNTRIYINVYADRYSVISSEDFTEDDLPF